MVIIAGLVLAAAAVLLVLDPLIRPQTAPPEDFEPERDPVLDRRDLALAALKEIEFDRATGKLSDDDFDRLRRRYAGDAVTALREADEALQPGTSEDAVERLIAETRVKVRGKKFCSQCGGLLEGSGKFCVECGAATNGGGTP